MIKITAEHSARSAFVCVRQSTADYLRHNHERRRAPIYQVTAGRIFRDGQQTVVIDCVVAVRTGWLDVKTPIRRHAVR